MKQTILTVKQSKLLEDLIVKHGQIVTSEQIYIEAKGSWDQQQAKKIITKLVSNGWLIRIKRGLYAISNFSNRGFLSLSPYTVANLLVKDSYVSFETALAYHGMFDQLIDKVISISQVRYKTVKLNTTEYGFINTKDKFFFGWQEVKIDNRTARVATMEKALIDTVHFHKSKYSIDLVIEKMSKYQTSLNIARLSKYVSKMSSTTIKIFGYIFDLLNIDSSSLHELVKTNKGTHWMLVGDKKFNAKWRMYYDEYFDKYRLDK
ncbi:type IV toxin-antitoxin system AbiEi family antitoxin domain-containing protein [Patescibacteria group bacterium]|nr:type IV toxin-antitoxin system AbiEi family antitoxin domain-containing protein [Patescibacteria group bacterium]